jgi:TrmH family RNA methyltransferase
MLTKEITSLQHPFIKHIVQLRIDRDVRQASQQALVAGHKLIQELSSCISFDLLIFEENYTLPSFLKAKEYLRVTDAILKKITGLEQPEPIAALVPLPKQQNFSKKKFLLSLDGVSDPGNLGTLIRTAYALGWEGIFLTPSTCDPFNDKAIRAAKGASFFLPIQQGTYEELQDLVEKNSLNAYVADAKGTPFDKKSVRQPIFLILGNEAQGVNVMLKKKYPCLSLQIQNIDSLNVAVAGAILMYVIKEA